MNHITAMKLALDALIAATPVKAKDPQMQAVAIVALQEALAQPAPVPWSQALESVWAEDYTTPPAAPVQEPVGNVVLRDGLATLLMSRDIKSTDQRLYTTPPAAILQDAQPLRGAMPWEQLYPQFERATPPAQPAPEQYTAMEQALTRLQKRYGELEAKVAAQPAPVQEPVAWMVIGDGEYGEYTPGTHFDTVGYKEYWERRGYELQPLYTTPPAQEFVCSTGLCHYKAKRPWVGLTDEDCKGLNVGDMVVAMWADRVLKEKNNMAAGLTDQRQPLTEDEVLRLWAGDVSRPVLGKNKVLAFARAIAAAYGITGEKT